MIVVYLIGVADAGKSTLIRMLIKRQEHAHEMSDVQNFLAPVPGSVQHSNEPTTGDVHLYCDPASWVGQRPLLYADCEGLEGGEAVPYGAKLRSEGHKSKEKARKVLRGVTRELPWMSGEMGTRNFAVTNLYPRLLYTFSDVVVFVVRNEKYKIYQQPSH